MCGNLLLGLGLFASLSGSIILFCGADKKAPFDKLIKIAVLISAVAVSFSSAYLMYLIFSNNFEFEYVASYSSTDLPFIYKVSAFWAGQQGSFLLWILIHALAGVILYKNNSFSGKGLGVYLLVESLLIIMTLGKSPFEPAEVVGVDGIGLNPLLQDPWMAIHPPVVFIGYSLLAVPFSLGMGALLDDLDSREWLETSRKWTLMAWGFLGAGIFIGGYWAYKVLGWGGYWGWDPVENSSLVPWLLAGIYLHLIKITKIRKTAIATLHLAGVFTYSAVIYGTFLTRSGILGDFSVHSFSGTTIGLMLAVVNGVLLLAGLFLLTVKMKKLPQGKLYDTFSTREFIVLLGMLTLMFISLVVFLGMSMPLLTQLAGKAAAVDTGFYEKLCTPLAVMLMITMFLASWYGYGRENVIVVTDGMKSIIIAVALGVVSTTWAGVTSPFAIALGAVSAAAAMATWQAYKKKTISTGGMIAHLGVSLGLLAMVLSGSGSKAVSQEIAQNEGISALGYNITYKGQEIFSEADYKEYIYEVNGSEAKALTKLRKNGEDAAREPAIYRGLLGDVYIAPSPAKFDNIIEMALKFGKMDMDEQFGYRYEGVEMEPDSENPVQTIITAKISITDGTDIDTVYPVITATETGATSKPIDIMQGKKQLRLTGVSADQKSVRVEVLPSREEIAAITVRASISTKPFIWLLWLSTVMVTAGCLWATKK